ncbi:MAG: extracellular solute-binding protein [Lachnospiraceae bacterium]|nr:extracellular solute-binding protein [Lachnospiraceae bacterium]
MKKAKKIIVKTALVFLLTMLSACGKKDVVEEKEETSQVIKIPVIFTVDPTTGKKNNYELAAAFNEAYEGKYYLDVSWVLETEEEYRQNLRRMNVTDTLPAIIYDVCTVPSFYKMMVEDERIENLTPYIESDPEWKEMIEPAVLKGCTYENGNIYLGPISTAAFTCSGMFWNEDLFRAAGIEEFPKTWSDFWKVCDKLDAKGIIPLALHTEGTGWAPMLISTASIADTDEGLAFMREVLPDTYDTKSGRKLVTNIQKLFQYTTKDAIHSDYDVAYSNFFTGTAAMIPNGYWMIDQVPEKWNDRVRFSAFPENTMVASPETFGWAIVSSYSDEIKEAAVEFLKFRTRFNKGEKENFFAKESNQTEGLYKDYMHAFESVERIVPNYQVKWNSILQEKTLGKALALTADNSISPDEFIDMMNESVIEYNKEQ